MTVSGSARTLGALLLVVFLCYAPALNNDFTMDDRHAAMGIDPHGLPRLMIYELESRWEYFSSHYRRGDHEVDDLFRQQDKPDSGSGGAFEWTGCDPRRCLRVCG